jgi:hypothetical protein
MHSAIDIPAPILFNTWKHHAGFVRNQILQIIESGAVNLAALPARLQVIGTDLMDLYTGTLKPDEIAGGILAQLCEMERLAPEAYGQWLQEAGGFRLLTLPDESRWVLRKGADAERYMHIHPGRWSPQTRRVRANVLKTAIMVLASAGTHGGDPLQTKLVNEVRARLQLAPVPKVNADESLAEVIGLLSLAK